MVTLREKPAVLLYHSQDTFHPAFSTSESTMSYSDIISHLFMQHLQSHEFEDFRIKRRNMIVPFT
jgi:hypothetical protein